MINYYDFIIYLNTNPCQYYVEKLPLGRRSTVRNRGCLNFFLMIFRLKILRTTKLLAIFYL